MSHRNFRDLDLLRQMEFEMSRVADEALRGFYTDVPVPNKYWQPRVDVYEIPDSVIIKAELSGVRAESLNVVISTDDRVLTISGERSEEDIERSERIRCYQLEINYGPFERQVMLPVDYRVDRDHIEAVCRDGFLVVTLPRKRASKRTRIIPITN